MVRPRLIPPRDAFAAASLILASLGGPALAADAPSVEVVSPDGRLRLILSSREGRLWHQSRLAGADVIEASPLGIAVDGADLGRGASLGRVERYRLRESYPWRGVHAQAVNHCNGARLAIGHPAGPYTVDARVFNDGVAFRFEVPGGAQPRVPDAGTSFRLPAGSVVWYHDHEGHYEGIHRRKDVSEVTAGDWAPPPLTVKLPGGRGYASITEAALFAYSGMVLQAEGPRSFRERLGHEAPPSYPFRLRYKEDVERLARPAAVSGPIRTPWRVVLVGRDLNTLVNSDVVHNLAPPPDPKLFPVGMETTWTRPGRAVWRYLDGGEATFEGTKEFTDLAAQLGFEYNLLEGFWRKWPEAQLRELVSYARGHGVGIWLWRHGREVRDRDERRKFFQMCGDVGVVGVKLDFYDHEHREVVEHYEAALRDAAEFHLMVNFHGANKPTGEARTWPNEMTREGVYGLENRRTEAWARHNATLPFTRYLAGHADYTPVVFGERRKETSWTHQIATAALFTSPLLVYGGHPKSLLDNPGREMIKSIPSVWDETVVLPASEIGEVAAFARRRGQQWFLVVVNGPEARSLRLNLSFLGRDLYTTFLLRDDPAEAAALKVESGQARRGDPLGIDLRAGGGFVARFTPEGSRR